MISYYIDILLLFCCSMLSYCCWLNTATNTFLCPQGRQFRAIRFFSLAKSCYFISLPLCRHTSEVGNGRPVQGFIKWLNWPSVNFITVVFYWYSWALISLQIHVWKKIPAHRERAKGKEAKHRLYNYGHTLKSTRLWIIRSQKMSHRLKD